MTVTEAVAIERETKPAGRMRARMLTGTMWVTGGQLATLGTGFLLTPFIIRALGAEAYGAWTLTTVLTNYLIFTDLGQGPTSTKLASEAHQAGDDSGEACVIWTSLSLLAPASAVAAAALALLAQYVVVVILEVPPHLQHPTVLALRFACLGYFARSLIGVLNTPQLVRMRLDLFASVNSGTSILQTCLVLTALMLGGGLVAASAVAAGVGLLAAALQGAIALRLQPGLARFGIRTNLVAPLLRFGSPFVVSTLVGSVLFQGERFLLAGFVGIRELAYYTVAFTLAQLIDLVPTALSQTTLPAFTQAQSTGDARCLRSLYAFAIRATVLYVVPVALAIFTAGEQFLAYWAGAEFARAGIHCLYVITLGKIADVLAHSPRVLLAALGRPGIVARIHAAEVVPYLVLGVLLINQFGVIGAAAVWSLRSLAECALVFIAAGRLLRSDASSRDVMAIPSVSG